MHTFKYQAKPIVDEYGTVTGWENILHVDYKNPLPRGYQPFYSTTKHEYVKIEADQAGAWALVEDTDAKKADNIAALVVSDRATRLQAYCKSIENDIDDAADLAALKTVLKGVLKDMLDHQYL